MSSPSAEVSAAPVALAAVARRGEAWSDGWAAAGRRLEGALDAAGVDEVPWWVRSLGHEVVTLASAWEGLDHWVGRVGAAFAAADAGLIGPPAPVRWLPSHSPVLASVAGGPSWVDALSDTEAEARVLAVGRALSAGGAFVTGADRAALRAQLRPLWERVRRRWPDAVLRSPSGVDRCAVGPPAGLDAALDSMLLPGPGRERRTAGVLEALGSGFVRGADDEDGYDDLGAEIARTIGHVASGVAVFGDARDAAVEASRGNGWGVAASVFGLVPGAGDALRGAKSIDDLADAAGDLPTHFRVDLDDQQQLGGHMWDHVGKTEADLRSRFAVERAQGRSISGSSSFVDRAVAEAAVEQALSARMDVVERITLGGQQKTTLTVDAGHVVGSIYPEVGPPLLTTKLTVVLRSDEASPHGFRVQSAFPAAMTTDPYPGLTEFLGSYFYEGSHAEYPTFEAAIDDFLVGNRSTPWPGSVLEELNRLLASSDNDDPLERSSAGLTLGFLPAGLTVRAFLVDVRDRLAAGL